MKQKKEITAEKLVDMLLNLERSGGLKNTIVAYKSDTPAPMNKKSRITGNATPWEVVRKITVAGGRLGVNYKKAVENKAENIRGEKVTFEPEKMKGKSHFEGSKVIAFKDSDPAVKYLILDVRSANKPKTAYIADGKQVEKSVLLEYMGKPPAPSFIPWRTVTVDNIKEISLNGQKYIVK